jgi:hypothetical protein
VNAVVGAEQAVAVSRMAVARRRNSERILVGPFDGGFGPETKDGKKAVYFVTSWQLYVGYVMRATLITQRGKQKTGRGLWPVFRIEQLETIIVCRPI